MSQDTFDWILLLLRWLHITTGVTWIGTSIFFMWLDRSFVKNPNSDKEGHVGDLWMVHGGGFYYVEKLLMGPTKVPDTLHWFKWESYWTWMSGFALLASIFYTGEGTFLLDETVSNITFGQGVLISLFSIFGSWFFYDFVWERGSIRDNPIGGHFLTLVWFIGMTYFLTHTLSGRAAYIHVGAMLGTWMTANVFMRIIPRQVKMVEATKNGEAVNQDWGKNAKNRSTHNTYFTLPVIFIMLSNHFPSTYGHEYNWIILILISGAGAAIREYFVVRLHNALRAKMFLGIGFLLLVFLVTWTRDPAVIEEAHTHNHAPKEVKVIAAPKKEEVKAQKIEMHAKSESGDIAAVKYSLKGVIKFEGKVPQGKKLRLPRACAAMFKGPVYSNEVIVNDGKLQNVLLRITSGHGTLESTPVPSTPVEIDQKGCIYLPRVSAVRAGQPVTFINSDPVFHNVKSVTKKNSKFNLIMPKKNQRITKVFKEPEITLQTKCSVHPWMSAYVAVVDNSFFDLTGSDGTFEIKDLPAGDYEIEAWHEVYGTQKKTVTVGENSNVEFVFKGK